MTPRDIWRWLRTATGDDAYERYAEHRTKKHPGEPLLSRTAFYEESQRRKWGGGVTRCC
ncbi:MAG: CstA-like transporter-associated (seleno)protein [Steroidobacteraceae bacterium]